MPPKGKGAVPLSADARQFKALLGKTSAFEPKLRTALRNRIRAEAGKGAEDSRREVGKTPGTVSSAPRRTGLRAGIAAGLKVQVAANGQRKVGVFIRSTGSGLPASKKRLVRLWDNDKGWRHPVYAKGGKSIGKARARAERAKGKGSLAEGIAKVGVNAARGGATWVQQKGRPYFGSVIAKREQEIAEGVRRALEEAARTL